MHSDLAVMLRRARPGALLCGSGLRWAIEQCFEEGKTELGMAYYEVRTYPGWHHHILMTMLAHFFLWHLKIRLGKKLPLSQFRKCGCS